MDIESTEHEMRIGHLLWQSAKQLSPKVVGALKFRALSFNRRICIAVPLILISLIANPNYITFYNFI
jgi:hypothetical protein